METKLHRELSNRHIQLIAIGVRLVQDYYGLVNPFI